MGKEITIQIKAKVPIDATDEQIGEWAEWNTCGGSISLDNPLIDECFESEDFEITDYD